MEARLDSVNPVLERFADRLAGPLLGLVDEAERQRFRTEALVHLEMLAERYIGRGLSVEEATRYALKEYGEPEEGADQYLQIWYDDAAHSPISKRFGRGNLTAFCLFAFAQAMYVALMQVRVFFPSDAAYAIPLNPVKLQRLWPEPLPFPEFSFEFVALVGFPVVAPIVAGWITGRLVPVGAAKAVYLALTPIILYSFVMGVLFLPMTEGILFALFQVAFWLPVGCLMAHLSSSITRKRRVRNAASKVAPASAHPAS